jgi:hypothetical protein
MPEKQFSYNARWSALCASGGFFALGSAVFACKAAANDRGLVIEYLINLGREGATTFYWGLAVFSALFVLVFIASALRRIVCPRTVGLDGSGLWIPHGFLQTQEARVQFSEILTVSERKVGRGATLRLRTQGRTYSIAELLLPSRREYDDIKSTIVSAVQATSLPPPPFSPLPPVQNPDRHPQPSRPLSREFA